MPQTDSTKASDKPVADKEKDSATDKLHREVDDERRAGRGKTPSTGSDAPGTPKEKPDCSEPKKPEIAKTDGGKPDGVKPETKQPDATKPEAAKPAAITPEENKADATKPEATKLEAAKPAATKPDASKPDATKPGAAKPDATKPQGTDDASKPWTVVLNMTANLPLRNGQTLGADAKLNEVRTQVGDYLKSHPEIDKSKVDILVQSLDPQSKKDAKGKDEFTLHRFEIRDGQVQNLPDRKSEGPAADLQHVLRDAVDRNPNAKLALANFMHGNPEKGFKGDNGIISLDQMRDTIKKGLADKTPDANGERKLDVLDADSCLLGSNGVASKLKDVTNNLVASEDVETASTKSINAQHEASWMTDLYKKPEMTGTQLGNDIVDKERAAQTTKDANGQTVPAPLTSVTTLANYDLRQYDQFKKSFDGLTTSLSAASADRNNLESLKKVASDMPRMDDTHRSDVNLLSKHLQDAIANGSLKDSDGSIAKSIEQLQTSENKLVTNRFIDANVNEHDRMGGISVTFPIKPVTPQKETLVGMLQQPHYTGDNNAQKVDVPVYKQLVDDLRKQASTERLSPTERRAVENLTYDYQMLKQSPDENSRAVVAQKIGFDAKQLTDSTLSEHLSQKKNAELMRDENKMLEAERKLDGDRWVDLVTKWTNDR